MKNGDLEIFAMSIVPGLFCSNAFCVFITVLSFLWFWSSMLPSSLLLVANSAEVSSICISFLRSVFICSEFLFSITFCITLGLSTLMCF